MKTKEEIATKYSGLINKVKNNPELLRQLPTQVCAKFIFHLRRVLSREEIADIEDAAYEIHGELFEYYLIKEGAMS